MLLCNFFPFFINHAYLTVTKVFNTNQLLQILAKKKLNTKYTKYCLYFLLNVDTTNCMVYLLLHNHKSLKRHHISIWQWILKKVIICHLTTLRKSVALVGRSVNCFPCCPKCFALNVRFFNFF